MRTPRYQEMRPTTGAYVSFYCEACSAQFSSSPDVGGAIGTQLKNSLLRQIPIIGSFFSGSVQEIDRDAHWQQVAQQFAECAQCKKVVCHGCYDGKQQKCTHCRVDEAAQEVGKKMGDAAANVANAAAAAAGAMGAALGGLGGLAALAFVDCPSCKEKTPRAKNCQHCGKPIPESVYKTPRCSKCNSALMPGAKFCPKCGGAATTA